MTHRWVVLGATIVLLALFAGAAEESSPRSSFARITFLAGTASVRTQQDVKSLSEGALVRMGQTILSGKDSRVEMTFLDKTVVRLGPDSSYDIEAASYANNVRSSFTAKLTKGRVWANVAKASVRSPFGIRTPSAMIRVRGTIYDLKAQADATEVSVYTGEVGVGPPLIEENAEHEEIAWPEEVTEAEWKEVILTRLQRLRIADGKPGTAEGFSPDQEQDPWVIWNQARDSDASQAR